MGKFQIKNSYLQRKIADSDVLISVGENIANFNGYIELNTSAAFLCSELKTPHTVEKLASAFELTVRCNLHCKMCLFRHDDSENQEIMKKELSTAQWIDLAEQAAEEGTFQLLITGGEPMLRPDFCQIWEGIYACGFILELYTNAALVTPKIMETLRKYPPHMIGVTLYGASPETYEKVCGNAATFEKTLEGIRMLQTLPSVIRFRTTLIKDNVQDLEAMEALLHDTLGVDSVLTHSKMVTKAVRGGCANAETCRLSPEESLELTIGRMRNHLRKKRNIPPEERFQLTRLAPKEDEKKRLSLFGCKAGMASYTITWDGKLQGCQLLGAFATDAAALGFRKAWEEFPFRVQLPPPNPKCMKCENNSLCECCPAYRYSETGDLQGVPEYICQTTEATIRNLRKTSI